MPQFLNPCEEGMVGETTAVSLTVESLSGGATPQASPKKKRTAKAVRFFLGRVR
jgi:hypothetical protein